MCALCRGKVKHDMTFIYSGVSFSSEFLEVVKRTRQRLQRVRLSKGQVFIKKHSMKCEQS